MKLLLTLCMLLMPTTSIFAQDVIIKKDIIYKDDVPYARILKSGTLVHDFSIRTLDGDEILSAIYQREQQDYVVTFMASGNQARMHGDFSFAKKLARELVISDIIKDGKLNPAGERRFVMLHPMGGSAVPETDMPPGSVVVPNNEVQPERSRNTPIMVFGEEIKQNNVTIGYYSVSRNAADGTVYTTYTIFSKRRHKMAYVTFKGIGVKVGTIILPTDKSSDTITIKGLDDVSTVKEIAAWLIDHGLL